MFITLHQDLFCVSYRTLKRGIHRFPRNLNGTRSCLYMLASLVLSCRIISWCYIRIQSNNSTRFRRSDRHFRHFKCKCNLSKPHWTTKSPPHIVRIVRLKEIKNATQNHHLWRGNWKWRPKSQDVRCYEHAIARSYFDLVNHLTTSINGYSLVRIRQANRSKQGLRVHVILTAPLLFFSSPWQLRMRELSIRRSLWLSSR